MKIKQGRIRKMMLSNWQYTLSNIKQDGGLFHKAIRHMAGYKEDNLNQTQYDTN